MFHEIVAQYMAFQSDENCLSAFRIRSEAGTGKYRVLDEFLHHSTVPEDARDPPEFTRSSVRICARTGVLSDEYGRKWRLHENVAVDTFTFDGVFDTWEQLATREYFHGQFHVWVVDEVDCLTPSQWRTLITTHEACPRVFEMLAGGEAQFQPIGLDGGLAAAEKIAHTKPVRCTLTLRPSVFLSSRAAPVGARHRLHRGRRGAPECRGRGHHATGGSTVRGPTPDGSRRRNTGGHCSGHDIMVSTFFEGQQPLEEIVDTKGDTRRITLFAGMQNMCSRTTKTRLAVW